MAVPPRPRRKSIFGGLLWVVIGSLLLANNLGAQFGFWEMLFNWWPLLLILLGLGKLFEHYAATRSGEPPARLLSGGEIFLLILLFLMAGAYTGIVQIAGDDVDLDLPWWNPYTITEEAKIAAKPNSKIVIEVPRGNVTLHPEDIAEIRVVANKSLRAEDEAEAEQIAKNYGVTVRESGGVFEVRGTTPTLREIDNNKFPRIRRGRWGQGRVSIDLEVHVPRQSNVDIRTERGAINVIGLAGNLTTNSRSRDVEIRDVTGNVDVEVRGGDIHVTNTKGDLRMTGSGGQVDIADVTGQAQVNGEYSGPIRFKNVAKEVRFNSRRSDITLSTLKGTLELNSSDMEIFEAGNVNVTTSNYSIIVENPTGRVVADNKNGDIVLRYNAPPGADVEINNERADVEITMPQKAEFTVDASSRNGRAESDFKDGVRVTGGEREGERDGKIEGKVGQRGPTIKVRTTTGTVRLRHGN